MPPKRVKKVMTLPINVIFGHLQVRRMVKVVFENTRFRSGAMVVTCRGNLGVRSKRNNGGQRSEAASRLCHGLLDPMQVAA
jgi:hypothetical protein